MKPPKKQSGGTPKGTAACMEPSPKESDVLGAGVNAVQIGRWIDEAIAMSRKAAKDPVEFQRLGIWLQRMRRAIG